MVSQAYPRRESIKVVLFWRRPLYVWQNHPLHLRWQENMQQESRAQQSSKSYLDVEAAVHGQELGLQLLPDDADYDCGTMDTQRLLSLCGGGMCAGCLVSPRGSLQCCQGPTSGSLPLRVTTHHLKSSDLANFNVAEEVYGKRNSFGQWAPN